MENQMTVTREEWLAARKDHLAKEKEFTKLRDELSQQRRDLPRVKVDKEYVFEGINGRESLADLFAGRSQLIVYHFMFGPDWEEGCPSCSFWADNYDGIIQHLNHRDVTMVTVSRAPLDRLENYRKRMGWGFKWLSSSENEFNRDYQVSYTAEDIKTSESYYNYKYQPRIYGDEEAPGISVFYRDENGDVFHTYSTYARGLDMVIGTYQLLDLVPKGRDEEAVFAQSWIRRKDEYED